MITYGMLDIGVFEGNKLKNKENTAPWISRLEELRDTNNNGLVCGKSGQWARIFGTETEGKYNPITNPADIHVFFVRNCENGNKINCKVIVVPPNNLEKGKAPKVEIRKKFEQSKDVRIFEAYTQDPYNDELWKAFCEYCRGLF